MRDSRARQAALEAPVAGGEHAFVGQESLASEPMLILLPLLAVYIVLGVLYESTGAPHHHPLDAAICRGGGRSSRCGSSIWS